MNNDLIGLRMEVRRLTAENNEIRRDYHELCALDEAGLRTRIVALEEAAEQGRLNTDEIREENQSLASDLAAARERLLALQPEDDAFDVATRRQAERAGELQGLVDELRAENEALLDEITRHRGIPVADLLIEYRDTIRSLQAKLDEALATIDNLQAGEAR